MRSWLITKQIDHRPWAMPAGYWIWYQEWNNALFIHGRVDIAALRPFVPSPLHIDTIDGDAWISIVAFRMQHIRPRSMPSLSFISDFWEINVRTYVTAHDNKPGVYFLSMEGSKKLSCYVARAISGLPYVHTPITSSRENFSSAKLSYTFQQDKEEVKVDVLSTWLAERYCLYYDMGSKLFRYQVHHLPWGLHKARVSNLITNYPETKIKHMRFSSLFLTVLLSTPLLAVADDNQNNTNNTTTTPPTSFQNNNMNSNDFSWSETNNSTATGATTTTTGGPTAGDQSNTWWWPWPGGGGNSVPLDGGLSFLLIAGAGYGAKKYSDMKKNKATAEK